MSGVEVTQGIVFLALAITFAIAFLRPPRR